MQTSQLTGATRIIPILGHPISHVRAPRVYNPSFESAGLDWCQVPLGVHPDDLPAAFAMLARVENLQGLNITIPHKAAAFNLCSMLGPEALRTGIVNTLRREPDGCWAGESFDGIGFVEAAREHGLLRVDRPVLLVGTGGAGTAIGFALASAGVKDIILVNRDTQRAERLADELVAAIPALRVRTGMAHAGEAGLAVNATSLGIQPGQPMPFDTALLASDCALFDIIAARDTELMAAAQERGLLTLGGKPMIEHQVAAQIAFWQGAPFPLQVRT